MNQAPTVIGEFGVPFDLKKKHAYRSGDFGPQTRALDSYLDALDAVADVGRAPARVWIW